MIVELTKLLIRIWLRRVLRIFWVEKELPISPAMVGSEELQTVLAIIAIWDPQKTAPREQSPPLSAVNGLQKKRQNREGIPVLSGDIAGLGFGGSIGDEIMRTECGQVYGKGSRIYDDQVERKVVYSGDRLRCSVSSTCEGSGLSIESLSVILVL